ncbi:MAG: hypothetical protein K0U36_04830 [Alphaproteobacteria bacterium]|nr:hypothetical protein [Alphaproteobacteria bacterium]
MNDGGVREWHRVNEERQGTSINLPSEQGAPASISRASKIRPHQSAVRAKYARINQSCEQNTPASDNTENREHIKAKPKHRTKPKQSIRIKPLGKSDSMAGKETPAPPMVSAQNTIPSIYGGTYCLLATTSMRHMMITPIR